MERYIARHVLIAQLATLALVAFCFLQAQVRAQGLTKQILVSPPVGLAPGQSACITLWVRDVSLMRAQVKLHDERGAVIGQSDEATIPAGQFRSFNFNRSDIPLAGEAGTGRVQIRASVSSVRLTFSEAIDPVVVSIETISISDGKSNTVIVGEVIPTPGGGGNDTLKSGFGNDIITGIVPGQTLRVSVFNPLAPPPPGADVPKFKMLVAPLILLADGSVVAQGDEIALDPGEFHSFDFKRADLPLSGVPGTDRLQARVEIRRRFFPGFVSRFPQGELDGAPNVLELVDDSTGKTTTLSSKPKEIVVVGSK